MAIYDLGTASLAANGEVTGVGTTWKAPLTLIRVGATIVFKTEPVQIYTISEIISDTQVNVYNPNSETVPAGTGYAILAHDGITVQGLAQDVAETLRYYQSRETEVADAVDAFNNFDLADFDSKVTQVNTQHGDVVTIGAQVSADSAQVTADKNSAAASSASASADKDAAAASAQEAADYAASLDTSNLLRKDTNYTVVYSFQELRLKQPRFEGEFVYLNGYYEGSDLGGGIFIGKISGAESAVDNSGTIAKGDSFYWQRQVDNDKLTVECFGAKPYFTESAIGTFDNSAVFQSAFDELGYLYSSEKSRNYRVDKPIKLSGTGFSIDFSGGIISKTTTTKTGESSLIPVFGGFANVDINCVFYSTDTVRYFSIKNVSIWCDQAPEGDKPVAFFIPSATNYDFSYVQTRNCFYDFWFKNAWRGSFREVRTNNTVSHAWFYDGTRVDESGAETTRSQSATSLEFSGCYANTPGGSGFYLDRVDYTNFGITAVDHSGGASYRFISSNCDGAIGAENPTGNYIHCSSGVYNLYLSTYDNVDDLVNYVVNVDGSWTVLNLKGQFRTQKFRLAQVGGTGNSVKIGDSTYWNGQSQSVPACVCSSGNFLDVSVASGGSVRQYRNGSLQEFRSSFPSYNSIRNSTTTYNAGAVLRAGASTSQSSFTVPLYRINEVFPNFNKTTDNAEWIRLKVSNGNGVAYGAVFQANGGSIGLFDNSNQKYTASGGENARVTGVSISGDNLVVTLQGSVGPTAVLELSYL